MDRSPVATHQPAAGLSSLVSHLRHRSGVAHASTDVDTDTPTGGERVEGVLCSPPTLVEEDAGHA